MKQLLIPILLLICAISFAQKAFPGAEGFGALTRGAYSGSKQPKILIVDNLRPEETGNEATGRGSFLWCLTRPYPRIVLFEVSGTIDYRSRTEPITIVSGYLTVAGQTAPGHGITLRGTYLSFDFQHSDPSIAADHVVFQHIRLRAGDDTLGTHANGRDCMNVRTSNVIIDHCSFSWSIDELFGIGRGKNITISNNLFYEPLNNSLHYREGGDNRPQAHGFGMILYNSTNLSMVKNLIAYSIQRNPVSHSKSITMLNNLMYNPGCRVGIMVEDAEGAPVDLWYQGNVVLKTKNEDCVSSDYAAIIASSVPSGSRLFFQDNVCELSLLNPEMNEWDKVRNRNPNLRPVNVPPMPNAFYKILDSDDVEGYIMDSAGAFYFNRDAADRNVLEKVKNRTGETIDSPDPLPARAYNFNEAITQTNSGNFVNGFNWSSSPTSIIINGSNIYLHQQCSTFSEVLNHIRSQLPESIEAYKCYGGYYIGFRTKQKGSNASITISGAYDDFGIPSGTYYGSDGVGGFPEIPEIYRPLKSIEGYPASNPHGKDVGNGYTNLENWIHNSYNFNDSSGMEPTDKNYRIYPNPSSGEVNIRINFDDALRFPLKGEIYDSVGKLVREISDINDFNIHVNGLDSSHAYMVKIHDSNNTLVCSDKIVIVNSK